jgi:glycosyltransferase involved in cell wall biosynthesis
MAERMPVVSVIIPFFNRLAWLRESIQSVLGQTLDDFELILVDDGSLEDAAPVIPEDEQIRYVRQENRGPAAARNRGIDMAWGKYVAFLDSDDLFLPEKLARQVAYLEDHAQTAWCHTSYCTFSTGGEIEVVHSGRFGGQVYPGITLNCPIALPTVMVRKEALDGGLRFEESTRVGEDIILWSRLAQRHVLAGIDEVLAQVRLHGRNAGSDARSQIAARMSLVERVIQPDQALSPNVKRKLLSAQYGTIAERYLELGQAGISLRFMGRALTTSPTDPARYSQIARGVVRIALGQGQRKAKTGR